MQLKDWRQSQGWTLAKTAEEVERLLNRRIIAATVQRWETGESRPDADVIDAFETLSGGEVTANDHQAARLTWLNSRELEVIEE